MEFERTMKVTKATRANPNSKLLSVQFAEMDNEYSDTFAWAPRWGDLLKLMLQSLIVETQNHPEKIEDFRKALQGVRSMKKLLVTKRRREMGPSP